MIFVVYLEELRCSCDVTFVDGAWRGEKLLNLKQISDGAMAICDEKLVDLIRRCRTFVAA